METLIGGGGSSVRGLHGSRKRIIPPGQPHNWLCDKQDGHCFLRVLLSLSLIGLVRKTLKWVPSLRFTMMTRSQVHPSTLTERIDYLGAHLTDYRPSWYPSTCSATLTNTWIHVHVQSPLYTPLRKTHAFTHAAASLIASRSGFYHGSSPIWGDECYPRGLG